VRLRERLPVLWQGPTEVRFGTDPRWAVVLGDLSPSAARALTALTPGCPERSVRAALAHEGTPPDEAEAILGHLRSAHLLIDGTPVSSPDGAVLALLEADGGSSAVLARRATARILVSGLGRLGASLVMTLAAAGVCRIELDDPSTVTRHDVGWAGLVPADVGSRRCEAVRRAVRAALPDAQVATHTGCPVDLVVLVEHGVADPTKHRPLVTDGTCHLSVVIREASVLVGPLVRPGVTSCLRCVDLHRASRDPDWPAVAAQLAVRRPQPEETVLAAVGGALAAAQVLAFLDGRTSAVEGAAMDVRLPEAVPRRVGWAPHPECGCAGLP
jgi:hypothetical protein